MQMGATGTEQQIPLTEELDFVEKQNVAAGETASKDNWAYRLEGPKGYVVFIQGGTEFAPEFRDASGNKLDGSTRVLWQKCNKQGDPLSEYIINDTLDRYNYERFRNDPDYFRYTQKDLMLDEREIAKIFVEIPSGANGFDSGMSRISVGDVTSDFGTPVEIIDHDDLSGQESQAVKTASQAGGK